jgi:hypothetical protein
MRWWGRRVWVEDWREGRRGIEGRRKERGNGRR